MKCSGRTLSLLAVWLFFAAFHPHGAAFGQSSGPAERFGRLPDGRAYRVDEKGFRLVDQLAELEVTADDLRRQVEALENQLRERDRAVERLRAGKTELDRPQVRENTIEPLQTRAKTSKTDPPNCNELVSNLYRRVAQLEKQVSNGLAASNGPAAQTASGATMRCDYDSPENPWRIENARLKTLLEQSAGKKTDAGEAPGPTKELEERLAQANAQISEKDDRVRSAQHELEAAQTRIASLEADVAGLRERSAKGAAKAKSDAQKAQTEPKRTVQAQGQPDPAAAHAESPAQSKKELRAALERISQGVLKRKDLLDQIKKRGSHVSIQIQPLATKSGVSLDQLRQEVHDLNSQSDVARLREGLQDVEKRLTDDVAVLQRLLKI